VRKTRGPFDDTRLEERRRVTAVALGDNLGRDSPRHARSMERKVLRKVGKQDGRLQGCSFHSAGHPKGGVWLCVCVCVYVRATQETR
jgi:hypothetical protein